MTRVTGERFYASEMPSGGLAQLARDLAGPHWHHRSCVLARLRIEGGVLPAAQSLAGELDEMVRHEAHSERGIDLAAPRRVAERPPERAPVIRLDADVPGDAAEQYGGGTQVGPGELAAHRAHQPVRIGMVHLMDEAREQPLRIVGMLDGAAPGGDHLVIRP